ncbi:flagellar hook-basal body protein [Paenibacillus sp. An7]|uniref:flagellar hook-basal body protein n=1 Tax=Paenibacillus sp. An7 TaxID=2689577 RepID=UPI001357D514|nr:flagellar hook-basal body protein [Paenibacillus sp. An7]
MIRGLYTAAAGMVAQQRKHDTVTQNIANLNTNGYKQVESLVRSFPEMQLSRSGDSSSPFSKVIGSLNTGVFAEESMSMNVQGDLIPSDKITDFALYSDLRVTNPNTGEAIPFDASGKYISDNGDVIYKPQAYFTVQDEEGNVKYTRDGSFQVDAEGRLLSSTGYEVLSDNGEPIRLTGAMNQFKVDEQGQLVNPLTGRVTGERLGITIVDDPYQLVREGNGNYVLSSGRAGSARLLGAEDRVQVKQGFLERSTVDSAQSMVDLTAALRAYEANQKVIQFYDKSLEKAVNEIGRV